jgi:hypothetical protein
MPAPFSPVHVAFVSGARQDLGKLAQENPAQLRQAKNVVFTKKGHISGRPGLRDKDAQTETTAAGGSLIADLATAVGSAVPSGIVATGFPTDTGSDTPLACWQGKSFYRRKTLWVSAGSHWSLRQTKSAILKTYDPLNVSRANPVPVGQTIVGVQTTGGGSTGFPILNSTGEISAMSLGAMTNFVSDANTSVAGDAVFFIDTGTGNAIVQVPNTLPAVIQTTVGTGADTSTTAKQNTSAVLANDGFYYLAFKSATAGRIDVVKISSVGAIVQTLSLTGLGSVQSVGLVHDGVSNLGLAWQDTAAGPALKTKVLTITAGVMADSGLNLTLSRPPLNLLGLDIGSLAVGVTHTGSMSVLYTTNLGSLYIGGRRFNAALEEPNTLLVGNGLGNEKEWDPLFGGVVVGGRTLVGVLNSVDQFNQSSQWLVLDVTKLHGSVNLSDRTVVASGPYLGAARMTPSSVYSTSTSVSFAVAEGLQFSATERSVPIIRRAGIRRITLSLQGVQAAHVNGTTLLSGQLAHVFDGATVRPDHFPEEMPFIFSVGTAASAGGSLAAGSYTYQATWESVNARGQVIRSGASNQKTITGVTAGQKVTVAISSPQMWNGLSQLDFMRVRLWATKVNPTANDPLFFVTELVDSTPAPRPPISLVHSAQAVGNEEQLYETATTLSDMRAPGADRGIAVVLERVWVADQNTLYASKLIRPNIAVSWNTEGPNTITLPSVLGTIQALASVNQGLVVLCSRGAAVVTGPGTDDTGAGPGWSLQVIDGVPGMGESSPRSAAAIPSGAAFNSQDGDLWLATSSGQAIALSRALRDSAITGAGVDVVNLTATPTNNAMLVAHGAGGVLRVLDQEMGQWCTWDFPLLTPTNGLFIANISGYLWIQAGSPGLVTSVDDVRTNTFVSDIVGVTARDIVGVVETGVLKPGGPATHGWGRLRAVVLNEVRNGDGDESADVTMVVLADQQDRILLNKTLLTDPTPLSPLTNAGDGSLEFRATSQRCSFFRVRVTVDPMMPRTSMEGLDLWVSNTGEATPTNNRS